MSDADISPQPYSEEWLRQRGAKYNPLTGKEVSPARPVSDLTRRDNSQEKLEPLNPAPTEVDKAPESPTPGPPVGPDSENKGPSGGRSGTDEYLEKPVVSSRKSRLPLIVGFALAIAAVVAAEHYIVPMVTHGASTTKPRQAIPGSSTNQVPETQTTRTVTPPVPNVSVVPIAKPNNATPKLPPNVHEETPTPSLPTLTSPAQAAPVQAAPVQAAPVQAAPPANKIIKSNVVPETFPAPVQHHEESNAQYEQQHLNQLMSPLG